jgi:hypothetical protein
VLSLRLGHGLSDFGAAVGTLEDEVDFRHAPMRLDLPDIHGEVSNAAGADDRSGLDVVVLDVGWHEGSPLRRKHGKSRPRVSLTADRDDNHQLFRTYKEHADKVGVCCILVTFQFPRLLPILKAGIRSTAERYSDAIIPHQGPVDMKLRQ